MKIRISNISGFCMGVKNAIDNVLESTNRQTGTIYVDGPVIHNPQVIGLLEEKGVRVLEDSDHPQAEDTVIIRAHGVPPDREKQFHEAGCRVINSTCPLVARIQKIIAREREAGRRIIIAGEKGHPEVIGLAGYAGEDGLVIETEEEIESIPADHPLALVAQSTQNIDSFNSLADRIKEVNADTSVYDTICRATRQRQEAVKQLAEKCDAVIVVGGRNSGNTKRLAQIAGEITPAFHVETPEELDPESLKGFHSVGIAGGASTPNWLIIAVKETLARIGETRSPLTHRIFKRGYRLLLNSNLLTALAGALLAYAFNAVMNIPDRATYSLLTFLYIFAMHTLNRFAKFGSYKFNSPARADFLARMRVLFITTALGALATAAVLTWIIDLRHLLILVLCSLPGVIYPLPIFPAALKRLGPYRSLKDIPGSKDIFTALGWAFIIVLFPSFGNPALFSAITLPAFVFIFLLATIRSVLFDILDLPGDRITGNETIPILLGFKGTRRLLVLLLSIALLTLVTGLGLGYIPLTGLIFLAPIAFLSGATALCTERTAYHPSLYEGLIDLIFILTGLGALIPS